MMVLCSNDSSIAFHAMARDGKLGWLMGPASWKRPRRSLPYALDNDAFGAWKNGTPWDEKAWLAMLEKAKNSQIEPLWALVPDVVANREATLENWTKYVGIVKSHGFTPAFAAQDGMTIEDVPEDAVVVFIGGTTQWKWRTLPMWVRSFPRVHLGRCGTSRWKLERLESLGVESCDGSGWFRATANGREARQLRAYLAHDKHQQEEFSYV